MTSTRLGHWRPQWQGVPNSGAKGGKITFYKPENVDTLVAPATPIESELADTIRTILDMAARYFIDLLSQCGAFGPNLLIPLWAICNGERSNDSLAPLRSLARQKVNKKKGGRRTPDGVFSEPTQTLLGPRVAGGSSDKKTPTNHPRHSPDSSIACRHGC